MAQSKETQSHFAVLREEARFLRKTGLSNGEIATRLGVGKTAVVRWARDIPMSPSQLGAIEQRRRETTIKANHVRSVSADKWHDAFEKQGFALAEQDSHFRTICALYWGEGGKTRRAFVFTNSDPAMIRIVVSWLVGKGYPVRIALRHHPGGATAENIRSFWMDYLPELEPAVVGHVQWVKRAKTFATPKRTMLHGCAQVIVYKAELWFLVMGGIEFLKTSYTSPLRSESPTLGLPVKRVDRPY